MRSQGLKKCGASYAEVTGSFNKSEVLMDLSDLSIEEQFQARSFNLTADSLSHDQAIQLSPTGIQ